MTAKKDNDADFILPGQYVKLDKVVPLTFTNINDPIQRAKKLYVSMGCPTRDEMKAMITEKQASGEENHNKHSITVDDVDLLPWNDTERKSWNRKPKKLDIKRFETKLNGSKKAEDHNDCNNPAKSNNSKEAVVGGGGLPVAKRRSSLYIPKPGESLTVDPLGSLKPNSFDMIYKLKDVINEGSFGVVYKGHHVLNKPDNIVAVKVVGRRNIVKDNNVINETSILRDIRHLPNITKVVDFYVGKTKLYIVQELARGGDVLDRLIEKEKYTEADARALAKNLLTTIQSLHDLKLVHRDLKPENLLIKDSSDDTDIMLCDFGYAAYLPNDGSGLRKRCGTPSYAAPEVINGDEYWSEIDMWSIGCIIFMLLCGQRPFEGDAVDLYEYICTAEYHFDVFMWDGISEEAKGLISNLLVLDRTKRLNASKALEHDWFVNCTHSQLSSNDITKSLDSIRHYCENIRPVENGHRCWQYDESNYMRSKSALFAERNSRSRSSEESRSSSISTVKEVASRNMSPSYIPQPGESLSVEKLGSLKVKSFDMVYKLGDEISKGSFGVVYKGHHVLNKPENVVAVKVVSRKNKSRDQSVIRETKILRNLRRLTRITKVLDFYMDETKIYIVQELARGGDVLDRLIEKERYTEDDARTLAKNLLRTIKKLHDVKLIHRDLKPENLLIRDSKDDTDIMLCDFGYASYLPKDGSGLRKRCGTPAYAAPEIINGVEYWAEVDMWSIGCLIYMLLCGTRPFDRDGADLYRCIRTADYEFDDPIWEVISPEAKELIKNLLVLDKKERFTAKKALQSDWFVKCKRAELSSNDITKSLDSIRNYCENIRPVENRQRCWQYDDTNYTRSRSAFQAARDKFLSSTNSESSNKSSLKSCGSLNGSDHRATRIRSRTNEQGSLNGSDHVIRAAELAKKQFDEAIEIGDVESVINAAKLAKKRFDEAFKKVEVQRHNQKKKHAKSGEESQTSGGEEKTQMDAIRIGRLQQRLSQFKQKQDKQVRAPQA